MIQNLGQTDFMNFVLMKNLARAKAQSRQDTPREVQIMASIKGKSP
jgi:hypothetical protein